MAASTVDIELTMPGRQYNALKDSLLEAQRRYQSLHEDLIGQSEANSELVRSLGMLKDANARLLEQLRYQNGQVEHITQLHLNAEETLEQMERKYRIEQEQLKTEMARSINITRDEAAVKYEKMSNEYNERLAITREQLEKARTEFATLEQQLQAEKAHYAQVEEALVTQVRQVEADIQAQLEAQAERFQEERRKVEEYLGGVQGELQQERSARTADLVEWSNKYALLVQDRDDLQCRLEREVAQLAAQLQAAERLLDTERRSWTEERATLQKHYNDAVTAHRAADSSFKQSQLQITRIMQQLTEAESESRLRTEQVTSLQRRVSDLEEELQRSQSSCLHLRQQLDEQHARLREAKEREVQQLKDHYEDRLRASRERADNERFTLNSNLNTLQEELDRRTVEAQSLRQSVEAAESDCATLQRDLDLWRRTAEKSQIARQDVEAELAQSKQLWSREKMNLEAILEETRTDNQRIKQILAETQTALQALQAATDAKISEQSSRINELESIAKQLTNEVNGSRSDNLDLSHQLQQTQQALEVERQRASEIVAQLERELALRTRKAEEDRQRFQATLEAEQTANNANKAQFDHWRENHLETLRKVQDDSQQQQQALERAKRRREDELMAQLGEQTQQIHNLQTRADNAEAELSRTRTALQESRHQSEWARQDFGEERRQVAEQNNVLRQRTAQMQAEIAELKRVEATNHATLAKLDQDKVFLISQNDELRARAGQQVAEAEARAMRSQQMQQQHQVIVQQTSNEAVVLEKRRNEDLQRENEALRRQLIGVTAAVAASPSGQMATTANNVVNVQLGATGKSFNSTFHTAASPYRATTYAGGARPSSAITPNSRLGATANISGLTANAFYGQQSGNNTQTVVSVSSRPQTTSAMPGQGSMDIHVIQSPSRKAADASLAAHRLENSINKV